MFSLPTCILAIVLASPLRAGAILTPDKLRCEFLNNPLGIVEEHPRLSWICKTSLAAVTGQRQTAFQIQASSSKTELNAGKAGLWDSGKVATDCSISVAYGGKPLPSGATCWWRVRLWNERNVQSAWSEPAMFVIGLRSSDDLKAEWIGMQFAEPDECPWFRKTFSVDKLPDTALACVASIGFHELYVNGNRVDDRVLAPSVSDLKKRALYVAYDIRPYLRVGNNAVAIWAAPGWSHFRDGNPKVDFGIRKAPLIYAQIQLGGPAGPYKYILSDATWRCSLSTTRHLGRWQNSDFGGDSVDLQKETPGWNGADFDDSGWQYASLYSAGLMLSPDIAEPNRVVAKIPASSLEQTGPQKWRFTMAHLYSGLVELKVKGDPGTHATIKISSLPNRELEYNERDEITLGDEGEGVFRNRFSYHEVKYVTVEGLINKPNLTDITGLAITNDRARTGYFDCSDPLLKKIYDTTIYNYVNLTAGGMTVDCPHRERLGYGGDGHTSLDLALGNFDTDAFYAKWARDWCDIEEPDGRSYHTAPTMGGGGGPAWSGFIVTMPHAVYETYGDVRILEETYPFARKWLDYLDRHVGADGLLQPLPGGYWFFLGDWLAPGRSEGADTQEALLFNNCYYLYVLHLFSGTAAILHNRNDEMLYKDRADKLKLAINDKFYNANTGVYLDSRQTHLIMPLISGAVDQANIEKVTRNLENEIKVAKKGHLDTGLHGTCFMTKYLTEHDRSDLIYTVAGQTTYPSYGDLLAKGNETWPETWENGDSRLHGCYNGIGGWFVNGILGIRPLVAGYSRFDVDPGIEGGPKWAKGSYDSVHGKISCEWRKEAGKLILRVVVPPNTLATIHMPVKGGSIPRESNKPITQLPSAKTIKYTNHRAQITVPSGEYTFTTDL